MKKDIHFKNALKHIKNKEWRKAKESVSLAKETFDSLAEEHLESLNLEMACGVHKIKEPVIPQELGFQLIDATEDRKRCYIRDDKVLLTNQGRGKWMIASKERAVTLRIMDQFEMMQALKMLGHKIVGISDWAANTGNYQTALTSS